MTAYTVGTQTSDQFVQRVNGNWEPIVATRDVYDSQTGGTLLGTVTSDADGTWTLTLPDGAPGYAWVDPGTGEPRSLVVDQNWVADQGKKADAAVPTTRTVNGHALSADVALAAGDVGAVPTSRQVNGKPLSADVTLAAADVGAATAAQGAKADSALQSAGLDAATAPLVTQQGSATAAALAAAFVALKNTKARYGSPPIASAFDVNSLRAVGGTKLAITTYVGGNNEVVEPSVWYDPNGLFGYEFWMAAGPYENSNSAYENPSIWCSHDGQNWQVPPGGSNPVVPAPPSGNYDDPHLYELGGTLYLIWNYSRAANSDQVLMASTQDGVTWTAPVALRTSADPSGHEYTSPHIEYQNGLWYMWTLNQIGGRAINLSTATSLTGTWSAPQVCTAALPTGKDHWEFEVRRVGSEWWMLQCVVNTGGTSSGGELRLRTSSDGINWSLSQRAVLTADPSGGGTRFDANFIYKASFVPLADGRMAIWYSAGSGGTLRWAIGYTIAGRVSQQPLNKTSWYAPTCPVSTGSLNSGTVYFIPVYFDNQKTLTSLGLEVTGAGSTGSTIELGIYADNGLGLPGNLIVDAGSIDGTTTGVKTLAISKQVGPGVVWLAALPLGAPTTNPTVRTSGGPSNVPIGASTAATASGGALAGHRQTSQSSLPTTANADPGFATSVVGRLIYQAG